MCLNVHSDLLNFGQEIFDGILFGIFVIILSDSLGINLRRALLLGKEVMYVTLYTCLSAVLVVLGA